MILGRAAEVWPAVGWPWSVHASSAVGGGGDGVPMHPVHLTFTQAGATAMLGDLLVELLAWVEQEGVPVPESARLAAVDALARYSGCTDVGIIGMHIQRFLKAVEVPVLVLCGKCPPTVAS